TEPFELLFRVQQRGVVEVEREKQVRVAGGGAHADRKRRRREHGAEAALRRGGGIDVQRVQVADGARERGDLFGDDLGGGGLALAADQLSIGHGCSSATKRLLRLRFPLHHRMVLHHL